MCDVLFILVIYQKTLTDSQAYQSLVDLMDEQTLCECLYVHDKTHNNQYLASAYNQGATIARERGKKWIVYLDDDTCITQEYISHLQHHISENKYQVIAPKLTDKHGKQLSPTSKYGTKVVFNSAMAIRLDTLQQIGGFNTRYPLDYLDYYTCRLLQQQHISITLMDVAIPHQLSVEDYHQITPERYDSILRAEKQFAKDTGNSTLYRLQLVARAVKWLLTGHKYVKETLKALK